jgi:hypothetical protein
MNRDSVLAARAEALRFIGRCDVLLGVEITRWNHTTEKFEKSTPWWNTNDPAPSQTGAVRRASMDLTRSLAAMRKP